MTKSRDDQARADDARANDEQANDMPSDEFCGDADAEPELDGDDTPTPARSSENGDETARLTELGNSVRLVSRFGKKFRFCRALGGWHVYDGKRWKLDTTGAISRSAKAIAKSLWSDAARALDEEMRQKLLAHARRSEKAAAIAAMVKLAESADGVAVESDAFDVDPWTLNCKNGLLDLRTIRLAPHDPAALCKKLAPVVFDPDARAPLFLRTLAEILPDAEVRAFVQRFFGYCLTGVVRERILALFIGNGRNGKSLLVKLIVRLMGSYATYAAPQLLMASDHGDRHPAEQADLCGIRFAALSEVREGQRFDVQTMKRLTGNEPVKARLMGQNFFTFEATWKLLLASNHRPKVADRTDSSWDRLREVPFTVRIDDAKEDKQLFEKLLAELPGILNWALEGCAAWQKDGLGTAGAITAATDDYRAGQDPLAPFFAECVVFGERGARIARTELYKAYTDWSRAEGERFPMSTRAFTEAVRKRGAVDVSNHGARWWSGARLRDENDESAITSSVTNQHDFQGDAHGCSSPGSFIDLPPREEIDRAKCTQVHPAPDPGSQRHAFSDLLDAPELDEPERRWWQQ